MGTCVLEQKYLLETPIAQGGQGTLWRARHRLGRPVAIKIGNASIATDPIKVQRFFDEGAISNDIASPHVLPAEDDGFDDQGSPFLVFPLIDGVDAERLRVRAGGRLAPPTVIALALHVLHALAAAHAVGIVHRDLKPENILIDREGRAYLIDFGAASHRAQLGARTITGGCAPLTPIYTAPEQARGAEATPRSDLFALGASMLALLSGRSPRRNAHPFATLMEAAARPLPRLRHLAPDAPHALAAIVDRAARFNPDDRYPSARAMWTDLARLLARSGSTEDR
jgi:serine/threonine-protein kinase